MYVVTVSPLTRNPHTSELTYYTATKCDTGTIVKASIRGKEVTALVTDSKPVTQSKTALKAATFTLRKLPNNPILGRLPASLIQVAKTLYERYPTSFGAILFALLPTEVRIGTVQYPASSETKSIQTKTIETPEKQILIASTPERYTQYQTQIRTAFAHGGSVLMVVPTAAEAVRASELLAVGIPNRVFCLTSHQTPTQRRATWNTIHQAKQCVLIITTPTYAYVERVDTTHIIIERSGNTMYRSRIRPYLDHVTVLETLAMVTHRSCVVADTILRTETEYVRRLSDLPELSEPPKRLALASRLEVIRDSREKSADHPFEHFFSETTASLQAALERRENVLLYAPRRGLAPIIACLDCGTIARCPRSGNPYSLLRTESNGREYRWFVDTSSGVKVRAADTCIHCGSWRLRERGVGIQQIEAVLPEYFPNVPYIVFDATIAKTPKQAKKLQQKMGDAKGIIILGTSMVLPYLPPNISHTCITSLEAAASIPSWRAEEFLLRLLLELREKTKKKVILQARHEPSPIVDLAISGAIQRFYDEELELRKQLQYPPFHTLILLSWSGTARQVGKIEEEIKLQLKDQEVQYYSPPISQTEQIIRYGLLRLPQTEWPETTLLERLRNLPPYIKIQINPDQIV